MKKTKNIVFLIAILFIFQAQKKWQVPSRYGFEIYHKYPIYYDIMVGLTDETGDTKINLSLKIQNDILQFTKKNDQYQAQYEISFHLRNNIKETFFSEIWNNIVTEKKFINTNSKYIYQNESRLFKITVPPGAYDIFIELMDLNSKNIYQSTRSISIAEYSYSDINHSELKFINTEDSLPCEIMLDENKYAIEFNTNPVAFIEIETKMPDSIYINLQLLSGPADNNNIISKKEYKILPEKQKFKFIESLNLISLPDGDYCLKFSVEYRLKTLLLTKEFSIIWFEKPIYLYKQDLALRPLQYILSDDEWKDVNSLSKQDQDQWFKDYWKRKDPDPETPFNELQYEFYKRIDKANKMFFLRFKEGWETDRGKSFILYGEPDNRQVYRNIAESLPYEIWVYDSLKQKLTFIDYNKNNDYKLVGIEDLEGN
jgi:GWxTD domain-containing protein